MKKVIFLDRDGVINRKPPRATYVRKWDDFKFLPGVIEALQLLTKKNYIIFIITNQAGIARGIMSETELETLHNHLLAFFKKNNIRIKDIYVCPHGWNEGCNCRKPKPGMLLQAAHDYHFNVTEAIFIGDDDRDELAGVAAGCHTVLMKPDRNLLELLKSSVIVSA